MKISEFREALIQMNTEKPCKKLKSNDGRHSWQAETVMVWDYGKTEITSKEALRCVHCRTVVAWPEDDVPSVTEATG